MTFLCPELHRFNLCIIRRRFVVRVMGVTAFVLILLLVSSEI